MRCSSTLSTFKIKSSRYARRAPPEAMQLARLDLCASGINPAQSKAACAWTFLVLVPPWPRHPWRNRPTSHTLSLALELDVVTPHLGRRLPFTPSQHSRPYSDTAMCPIYYVPYGPYGDQALLLKHVDLIELAQASIHYSHSPPSKPFALIV